MITREIYHEFFSGYIITDCCIRSKDIIYFIVEEDLELRPEGAEDTLPDTRFITHYTDELDPDEQWEHEGFFDLKRMKAGVSFTPEERFIGIDTWGQVFVIGGGSSGFEDHLHTNEGVSLTATACIDGKTWVVGTRRTIYRRDGTQDWSLISQGNELPIQSSGMEFFESIDGFNENDIYIGTNRGSIWHYNGKKWSQHTIELANNSVFNAICCAEDGYVYIGGSDGLLLKGRGTDWQIIENELNSLTIHKVVWFKDRLYFSNWLQLFELYEGQVNLIPSQPGFPPTFCGQALSARDGILVSAGPSGAVQYDGEEWTVLVGLTEDIQIQDEIKLLEQTSELLEDSSKLLDDLK